MTRFAIGTEGVYPKAIKVKKKTQENTLQKFTCVALVIKVSYQITAKKEENEQKRSEALLFRQIVKSPFSSLYCSPSCEWVVCTPHNGNKH